MTSRRRVAICIPTYQESASIVRVTRLIDAAVARARPDVDYVIVNVDNRSPDGTAELFRGVDTRTAKVSLLTPAGARGKGANIRQFLIYALEDQIDAGITLDADLEAVPTQWINALLDGTSDDRPLLNLPLYGRPANDANLTNHVVVPMLLAGTGHAIRQPIGGDFAVNRAFMGSILAADWPEPALGFGVDIFFVLHALDRAAYRQVGLDVGKLHGWRSHRPEQVDVEFGIKFNEVAGTLLGLLHARTAGRRGTDRRFPASSPLTATRVRGCDPAVMIAVAGQAHDRLRSSAAYQRLLGDAEEVLDRPLLDDAAWSGVLSRVWREWPNDHSDEFMSAFRALLYCRIATGQADLIALSPDEIEQRIIDVASRIRM